MFGKGRHRKRRLRKSDDIWLELIDMVTTILDEAEHDMRAMTRDYRPTSWPDISRTQPRRGVSSRPSAAISC